MNLVTILWFVYVVALILHLVVWVSRKVSIRRMAVSDKLGYLDHLKGRLYISGWRRMKEASLNTWLWLYLGLYSLLVMSGVLTDTSLYVAFLYGFAYLFVQAIFSFKKRNTKEEEE